MIYFSIKTPLNVNVRITEEYWDYLITIKHRIMKGREEIVKAVLCDPDEIRRSKIDEDVFLYYKRNERLYCVVARHEGKDGFILTAYPVDKTKEGEIVWTR